MVPSGGIGSISYRTEFLLTANQKSLVAKAIPLISLVSILGASLNLATKSGVFRDDGSALTRLKLADFADGHIQLLPRPGSLVGMSTLNPSTDQGLPQNSPKPLKFYNRKSKVKRASKMDVGLLAGERLLGFNAPPGFLPLAGGPSTGCSGLFSVVEPIGSQEVTPVDVLVPAISLGVLRHFGSVSARSKLS